VCCGKIRVTSETGYAHRTTEEIPGPTSMEMKSVEKDCTQKLLQNPGEEDCVMLFAIRRPGIATR